MTEAREMIEDGDERVKKGRGTEICTISQSLYSTDMCDLAWAGAFRHGIERISHISSPLQLVAFYGVTLNDSQACQYSRSASLRSRIRRESGPVFGSNAFDVSIVARIWRIWALR